jgi:threonine dehydrogenase-like Zn-dependent dehydrogenase
MSVAAATMPAIVFGEDGTEQLRDVRVPAPGPGEVLVQVEFCGICGSDLHAAEPDFRPGVTMGHEFAGTVAELGPGVEGWRVGDRVCVNPNGDWCGACAFCRVGQFNMCPGIWETTVGVARDGGMAPWAAVRARILHRLPEGVSTRQGAWVEPLAVAVRTVRTSGIAVGDDAVVFGAGPIGLLVIQVLRAAGAGRITAVEPSELRARLAGACGADELVDPRREDVAERFADLAAAPAHAFECTGVAAVTETALRVLRPHGRLTVTGFAREQPFYRAQDLLFKELEIRGSFIYLEEFRTAIELLERGAIDVAALTSDVRGVEAGVEAFADMRASERAVKILLQPSP